MVMAWARSYERTSEVEPYDSVLFCGICGQEVHVTRVADTRSGAWIAHEAELFAQAHMQAYHRFRYWLWQKVGWRWLVAGMETLR